MLKAVLEQDHPANRPTVLCISAIAYKGDGKVLHQQLQDQQQPAQQQQQQQQQQAIQSAGKQAQVQLTDGWYGVKAVLDQPLTRLVQTGQLRLGTRAIQHTGSALMVLQECWQAARTVHWDCISICAVMHGTML